MGEDISKGEPGPWVQYQAAQKEKKNFFLCFGNYKNKARCGLKESAPFGLMYLNIWSPVAAPVWGILGGIVSLEEI